MKKILSTFFCLAVLTCCLTSQAQAANPSLSPVCAAEYAAGEMFTVNITAADLKDCCSVAFCMTYDPALVEVTSITSSDALSSWLLVESPYYSDNELYVSLTGAEEKDLSGVIACITFTAKSTASGGTSFAITPLSAVDSTSAPIVFTGGQKSVTITPMKQALLTVSPAPGEDGKLLLNVDLSQASYYCGLTFILEYDSSRYTVSDAQRGTAFASAMGYLNTSYAPGRVFISTVFSTPSTINGRLATITLTPIAGIASAEDVSVEITDYVDGSFQTLDIAWTYTRGTVTSFAQSGSALTAEVVLVNSAPAAGNCSVIMAIYDENDRFLRASMATKQLEAGSAGVFDLSIPADSRGSYVKMFFLDDKCCPLTKAFRRDLDN